MFSWNRQHFSVFEVKPTSLSSTILMKSTFRCVWSEINIFWLIRSRETNILLCLKWNPHLCSHNLTWKQHFSVIEVGKNYFVVGRWLFNMWNVQAWRHHLRKSGFLACIICQTRNKNQWQKYGDGTFSILF